MTIQNEVQNKSTPELMEALEKSGSNKINNVMLFTDLDNSRLGWTLDSDFNWIRIPPSEKGEKTLADQIEGMGLKITGKVPAMVYPSRMKN